MTIKFYSNEYMALGSDLWRFGRVRWRKTREALAVVPATNPAS